MKDALDHQSLYELNPDSVVDSLDPLTIMCILEEYHDEIISQVEAGSRDPK